ncbi:tRNA (adenosine(37)-N6)-dimethylallyltransferase MiaA [Geosporobacter ferrireducens]|uniref:tRNA dimethylallyltransferase n=1 Tax=Geosporobacter ferrireducens TaxID=1424294 RepID=A0A1D8GPR8_9FIRM|nr:tRNA (adenosine(37)-N6)-dimethylallyltransferase MiaA [Geosporobacter ferrireducens]AOT72922.1 tRNA (adenosine(37)-N6)-dimethylallyltransferase MiaA [Geosporobacter ferrireducens]AOT73335.1 tRNA (adenosine(37)-N6)-dimethylallyltransferase MiaA [Geosporobacter ferrireducens]MTI55330.1 tRNA (adenosine(37)-N6)-dimethylallyltransferase MiaA [Geosporobacter ferrireducens]
MKKPLVIIVGPTGVGKTDLSIEIAKKMDGEIVSADSMQIYKHMDIGSAKPSIEEQDHIPHYLMDEIDPREEFSVAQYQKKAKAYIEKILLSGKLPIIVGGTGLYVNSIIYNIDFTATISNWNLRKQLEEEAHKYGNKYIHDKLRNIDSEAAERIHPNNLKRVIRALEVYYEGGEKIKDFQESLTENPAYQYAMIGLIRDRKELYERINLRVDLMIQQGLIEEVKNLMASGLDTDAISMKGLGYKEIIRYLKGDYSLEAAVEIIKRDTRRYAKRQITWFKRYDQIQWFDVGAYEEKKVFLHDITNFIEGKLNLL